MNLFLTRIGKLLDVVGSRYLLGVLFKHRVLAGVEHRILLNSKLKTVVDVGANRGQFSLAVREWAPQAQIVAFEPLPSAAHTFRSIFINDYQVTLHEFAIGPLAGTYQMHVSSRDDSSSLLPISDLQSKIFPGTAEASTLLVQVAPLDTFLDIDDIRGFSLLKLDVQGFEYDALVGCEKLLSAFDQIYCECSFVELYSGQKLAADVIRWLAFRGFYLSGVYNLSNNDDGQAIQADFLFERG